MSAEEPVALVTGANRGIGKEVSRQLAEKGFRVLLTGRSLAKAETATAELGHENLLPAQLDVSDPASIAALQGRVAQEFGRLNVLVNNAAILYDWGQRAATVDLATVQQAFDTNTLGPWRLCQAFIPLLRKSSHPHSNFIYLRLRP